MTALNNATSWMLLVFESDLPAPAKLTAAALRTFMNSHTEMAWPSVARLASMTTQHERTVQRHLKLLCDREFLLQNGFSSAGTHRYLINVKGAAQSHPRHRVTPAQSRGGVAQSRKGGGTESPELTKRTNNKQGVRFKPPNLDEVRAYCTERKNTVSPQVFLDHYQANGWMRGKNKIKDWKACVRTWEANEKQGVKNEHYF